MTSQFVKVKKKDDEGFLMHFKQEQIILKCVMPECGGTHGAATLNPSNFASKHVVFDDQTEQYYCKRAKQLGAFLS